MNCLLTRLLCCSCDCQMDNGSAVIGTNLCSLPVRYTGCHGTDLFKQPTKALPFCAWPECSYFDVKAGAHVYSGWRPGGLCSVSMIVALVTSDDTQYKNHYWSLWCSSNLHSWRVPLSAFSPPPIHTPSIGHVSQARV